MFTAGDGADTITDFEAGDTIAITGHRGGFSALRIKQDGADTVIGYGSDTIRLEDVQSAQLTVSDFDFPWFYFMG